MVHTNLIRPLKNEEVKADGHDKLELLYNWLEALLLKFELENKVFGKFDVHSILKEDSGFHLEASILGEPYDQGRHGRKVGVKGITYHQMSIESDQEHAEVRFLLDL